MFGSGLARFAAGRRIGAASLRSARFTNAYKATTPALPVFGARYMATEAQKTGKIHQVIGAVVDVVRSRTKKFAPREPLTSATSCKMVTALKMDSDRVQSIEIRL